MSCKLFNRLCIGAIIVLSFGASFAHNKLYQASASAWFYENREAISLSVTEPKLVDSFIPTGPPTPTYVVGPQKEAVPQKPAQKELNFGLLHPPVDSSISNECRNFE